MRLYKSKAPRTSILAALESIAQGYGHITRSGDPKPFHKNSYFQIDKEYSLPIESDDLTINGRKMVDVTCVCGAKKTYPASAVKRFIVTHCGCKKKGPDTPPSLDTNKKIHGNVKDMTGVEFKLLKVEEYLGIDEFGSTHDVLWKVRCACGTSIIISRRLLRLRKNLSCGSLLCTKLFREGYTFMEAATYLNKLHRDNPELLSKQREEAKRYNNQPKSRTRVAPIG